MIVEFFSSYFFREDFMFYSSRKTKFFLLLALMSLFLIVFFLPFHFTNVPFLIQSVLVRSGSWVTLQVQHWVGAATISPEELEELKAERDTYAVDYQELLQLREEKRQLESLLSFVDRQQHSYLSARVISRSASNLSSEFLIDLGESDGVEIGTSVVAGDGYFVGKVISTTTTTATVSPLTNRTSATAATLLNETRTIGIAQGEGGNILLLKYIPQDEQIEVHDLLVTSGLEQQVPGNLLIGIVTTVTTDSISPFQEAIIEPFIKIRELTAVAVLAKNTSL